MRKGRFTEEQSIRAFEEGEAGVAVKQLRRKHGICEQTYYRWKAKYEALEVSEAGRLQQLEEENRRLKHIVAEHVLDIQALRGVLEKGSDARGQPGGGGRDEARITEKRASGLS